MDFGALPPEVNSERMYAGPGSAPMMAAAAAWSGLASELNSAAQGYWEVITTLHSEEWLGPASVAMAEAVTPYVAWMRATAERAERTASQARAAAAAFEAAFAGVVPPPLIAANRAQIASLTAKNVYGQYNAAIAALEAEYAEMWAQDARTMYSYAGSSASAAQVTPFAPPPDTTSSESTQSGAVARAAAGQAGTAESTLSEVVSHLPNSLLSLTLPASALSQAAASTTPGWLEWLIQWYLPISQLIYNTTGLPYFGIGITSSLASTVSALGIVGPAAAKAAAGVAAAAGAAPAAVAGAAPIAASVGNAASAGALSVPPSWAPEPGLASAAPLKALPLTSDIVNPPEVGAPGNLLGGVPLAGTGAASAGSGPRYGFRPTVMAKPPFAG